MTIAIEGFEVFEHEQKGGTTHPVYYAGAGAPVIVLHEVLGLSPPCVAFANRLIQRGFRVYLPHLFGEANTEGSFVPNYGRLCISREFNRLRSGESAPISEWVRSLANVVSKDNGGTLVGAIGMCVTGGIVIPLVLDPTVNAVVSAQPAIPIPMPLVSKASTRRGIQVSDAVLDEIVKTTNQSDNVILGLRFSTDWKCPKERFQRLERTLGSRFEQIEIKVPDKAHGLKGHPHSVLTYDYDDADGHPTRKAFERVVTYLHERLAVGA
jgi:dienelactone hydrolase